MILSRPGRSEGMNQVLGGSDSAGLGTINSALSTPGYLLAILRELSQSPWALEEIVPKQVQKTNLTFFLYQLKKRVGKSVLML